MYPPVSKDVSGFRTNYFEGMQVVDLYPGDIFYFPAGMWHRVETLEYDVEHWAEEMKVPDHVSSKHKKNVSSKDCSSEAGEEDSMHGDQQPIDDDFENLTEDSNSLSEDGEASLVQDEDDSNTRTSENDSNSERLRMTNFELAGSSVSINFSLMGDRWADLIANNLKQMIISCKSNFLPEPEFAEQIPNDKTHCHRKIMGRMIDTARAGE